MSLKSAKRQMTRQLELPLGGGGGETLRARRSVEAWMAANEEGRSRTGRLMEWVVENGNLTRAMRKVRQNKGSPGIDGMDVEELTRHVEREWDRLRRELLAGDYQPQPVKRVEIPKPSGGIRQLGIPTVTDRLIQQMVLQVLQPTFDPTFSEHSYGFRPGRSAHQAVQAAQRYVQEGRAWVVDVDLEKFFDRVNHDILMSRLARRIEDKRMLKLIRRYLEAGVMVNGVVRERGEGTPQGGPLSPLLANVLLDEVDKELERRGHAFCRYADDGNVYVRSERAAKRVYQELTKLYGKLRLKVNESKSRVGLATQGQFLGYSFWRTPGKEVRRRVGKEALNAMKHRVRGITRRMGGRSMPQVTKELGTYLVGWKEYFHLAQTPRILTNLDGWIGHRLRMIQMKQWKRPTTVCRELKARGTDPYLAWTIARKPGWWRKSGHPAVNAALPTAHWSALGIPRLTESTVA